MKPPSLRSILLNYIQEHSRASLTEIHELARAHGKKESNAERCLRPSSSPEIETIYNEKGYVTAYVWKGNENNNIFRPVHVSEEEKLRLRREYPLLFEQEQQTFSPQSTLL